MFRTSDSLALGVRLWLAWSAWMALATMGLSALGALQGVGWALAVGGFLAGAVGWVFRYHRPKDAGARFRIGRYRRGLPLLFLLTFAAVVIGALAYAPTNIDTLWYRFPRVIQWIEAGRWHWLETERWRLNSIAFGLELHWLPFAAWGWPSRLLALPNVLSFLLLPGLLFRVFRQLGAGARIAYYSMWVVAGSWCYVAQAGSTASDSFSAVYTLAALDAALVFAKTGQLGALGWSLVAAALLTNTKQTNLPLLLPWAVAILSGWKHRRIVLRHLASGTGLVSSVVLVFILIAISNLPLLAANWHYTRSWSGAPQWANDRWKPAHPLFAMVIQIPLLILQNLQLPITPGTDIWNGWMERWTSGSWAPWFKGFDLPGRLFSQIGEHCVGLGFAPFGWLLITGLLGRSRETPVPNLRTGPPVRWVVLCGWLAGAVLLAGIAFVELARYFAAYYPLLLVPALWGNRTTQLTRQRLWRWGTMAVMLASLAFATTVRHRPWIAPPSLLRSPTLGKIGLLHRLGDALQFQTEFGNQLGSLVKFVPAGTPIGWAHDAPGEAEFDWPPGRRPIRLMPPDVPSEQIRANGIRWVVTSALNATNEIAALEQWANARGGKIRATAPFVYRFNNPPSHYALVEFPDSQPSP